MKAWELIQDPKRWTQHAIARDANGDDVGISPNGPNAVCWCAVGAVHRTYASLHIQDEIFERYLGLYETFLSTDNDSPGMTASKMSERLRVVEEMVLAEMGK